MGQVQNRMSDTSPCSRSDVGLEKVLLPERVFQMAFHCTCCHEEYPQVEPCERACDMHNQFQNRKMGLKMSVHTVPYFGREMSALHLVSFKERYLDFVPYLLLLQITYACYFCWLSLGQCGYIILIHSFSSGLYFSICNIYNLLFPYGQSSVPAASTCVVCTVSTYTIQAPARV